MRKIYLALLIPLLFLTACGFSANSSGNMPAAEEVVPTPAEEVEVPRIEETPDPGLPPTWTPPPPGSGGHLFGQDGGGSVEVPISGTRFIYVVQRGDTLGKIAEQYGVTVSDLATINNIQNINVIEVGQELIIPVTGDGN